MASIMNGNSIIRSTACSCALRKKHQSSALLALCQGNHWWIPHKGPLMRKMGSWHDVTMYMNYMFFPYRTETVWWQATGRARTTHSTKIRCHASVLRQSSATYRPQPARETAASVGYTWPLQQGRHAPALSNRCFKLVQTSSWTSRATQGHTAHHKTPFPKLLCRYVIIITSSNGTFSALLAFCDGNPSVTGGFPSQQPVSRSFDVSLIYAWTTIEAPVVWDAMSLTVTLL